jgi:hypothetical protein
MNIEGLDPNHDDDEGIPSQFQNTEALADLERRIYGHVLAAVDLDAIANLEAVTTSLVMRYLQSTQSPARRRTPLDWRGGDKRASSDTLGNGRNAPGATLDARGNGKRASSDARGDGPVAPGTTPGVHGDTTAKGTTPGVRGDTTAKGTAPGIKFSTLRGVLGDALPEIDADSLPEVTATDELAMDLAAQLIEGALRRLVEDPRRYMSYGPPHGVTPEEAAAVAFDEDCPYCVADKVQEEAERRHLAKHPMPEEEEPCPCCDMLVESWREANKEKLVKAGLADERHKAASPFKRSARIEVS